MSFDGREIANFILDECERVGRPVTNLSLQKILYFCHAWSLVNLQKPLIRHQFEAWEFGPVLPYIYKEFSEFDRRPISKRATKLDQNSGKRIPADYFFEEDIRVFLETIVSFYSRLSASSLVELSHVANGPWDVIWNHTERVLPGMKIRNEDITRFYSVIPHPFKAQ